jgi:hypothetical protein
MNEDLLAALKEMGYKAPEAKSRAARAIGALGEDAPLEALFKEALKKPETLNGMEVVSRDLPLPANPAQRFEEVPLPRRARPGVAVECQPLQVLSPQASSQSSYGWLVVLGLLGSLGWLIYYVGPVKFFTTIGVLATMSLFGLWKLGGTD